MNDDYRRMLRQEIELSELVVTKGIDVVPRFRIITPDGEYEVLVQMGSEPFDRYARLKLLAAFMAWKMTSAFVVSGENIHPPGIFSFAVSAEEVSGVFRSIEYDDKGKVTIGPLKFLDQDQCDPAFVMMLPGPNTEMDAETLEQIQKVFGLGGEMEARPVH